MQSIKDALGSVRDAMKKSYSRMPQALENNYEKLRRAYKKNGGKLKEKLAKVLDSIQKYLRKLKQILIKASKTVGARRVKRGVQPNAGTPEMSSTKPQVVDNTREILADFVVEQLTQYGFVKFFAEQGMTIDANTILNLEALGTKRGDNVLLENRSTMENTLHRILHMYMDRTGPKSDKDYNAQAQSLINILRPVLQEISKAGGDPNVGVYIEKINYMFDKNPAQELVIQYLTNTPFRSFISRLSPEIQAQFQSLAKEMVLFKDSAGRVTYNKTKSFIKIQDGLLMSDALYEEFINNTLQTPLDVLGDAMASGMDPVTFLLNRIAQPIDVFIAEEASAEDLQEIADEEGKSI
jgi:phosphotransferase system HPr-like phosphotransfer protein